MRKWINGSGNIELNIPDEVVMACARSDNNTEDIKRCVAHKDMQQQLYALDPKEVVKCIEEYFADIECFADIIPEELMDNHANLEILLWMACWDIEDGMFVE